MSKVLVEESNLTAIASAIRSKLGVQTTYKPGQMATAIGDIPTGVTPTGTVSITQNGTVDVTNYASASVNVPNSYAAGDEGKVVSSGTLVAQTARASEITANGTYDTTTNNSVTVNVSDGAETEPALPSEYQRVEYLDFTPSVGIVITIPTSGTILFEADFISRKSSGESIVFGYRESSSAAKDFAIGTYGNTIESFLRTPSQSNGIVVANGISYTIGSMATAKIILIAPRSTAMIGKYAYYNSAGEDFDGRFYNLKGENIDTGQKVSWFVPCYRKNDNKVGVYDHITQTFYCDTYTIGSGYAIVAGPDVTRGDV